MQRGKVDPGVSELPRGNELSRDHVNRPLLASVSFWPLLIIESVASVPQPELFMHDLLVKQV